MSVIFAHPFPLLRYKITTKFKKTAKNVMKILSIQKNALTLQSLSGNKIQTESNHIKIGV